MSTTLQLVTFIIDILLFFVVTGVVACVAYGLPAWMADMGCLFCLAVVLMCMGSVLGSASITAFDNQAMFIGLLLMLFAAAIVLLGVAVCLRTSLDYFQSDQGVSKQRISFRFNQHVLYSLGKVYRQPAFLQLLAKVIFFCSVFNFLGEWFNLRDCKIIYVSKTTPACGNHTMGSDMFVTSVAVGFFCTLFNFAEIQRGILGRLQTYPCTKKTVNPWIVAMHPKLLDRWFFRPFVTGNRLTVTRKYIWLRAVLMSINMVVIWEMPVFALIAFVNYQDAEWDGGMGRWEFVIFKTVWSTVEGVVCTLVGFAAATSADSVELTHERFGEPTVARPRSFREETEPFLGAPEVGGEPESSAGQGGGRGSFGSSVGHYGEIQ